jgi:hypothetical protein
LEVRCGSDVVVVVMCSGGGGESVVAVISGSGYGEAMVIWDVSLLFLVCGGDVVMMRVAAVDYFVLGFGVVTICGREV